MKNKFLMASAVIFFTMLAFACGTKNNDGEHNKATAVAESGREHTEEESAGRAGEESGAQLSVNDTYDNIRHEVRLILRYDEESSSFKGSLENTSEVMIEDIRVEVHLSNGTELGPTENIDLDLGEIAEVLLDATSQEFTTWSTHVEVGASEHTGEGDAEHGVGEEGEHDGEAGEHK